MKALFCAGPTAILRKVCDRFDIPMPRSPLAGRRDLKKQRRFIFEKDVRFSILVPLYNTPAKFLLPMLDSVVGQTYGGWELCLADGSDAEHGDVENICRQYAQKDSRIKYRRLTENLGISGNTNACLEMATGDYIALFDHDDCLHPSALFEVMKAICEKDADFVYTDECTFRGSIRNVLFTHFKPDYAPDTLRGNNYICHFTVFRRSLLEKAGGGFRSEYDGSQDFDMVLRLTEQAKTIVHIPRMLYYWRSHKGSVAESINEKPYAALAAQRAVTDHLKRVGLDGEAELFSPHAILRLKYAIKGEPLVSIIIPNKDHANELKNCLTSITNRTTYPNYEILVVENNSTEAATIAYYRTLENDPRIRVITYEGPFNYSAINNFAFKYARGEHILLLNNDIKVISPDWVQEMLMYSQRSDVGAVGCKLLYEDDTIQHAGVGIGLMGLAAHMHRNCPKGNGGYFGRLLYAQDLSAVTGACMMLPRHVFEQVNGLDENYAVAFNDIDLCMRIRSAGYLIVFTPFAEMYHLESKSRGEDDTPEKQARFDREVSLFKQRWAKALQQGDPYYNPNLSPDSESFETKRKPFSRLRNSFMPTKSTELKAFKEYFTVNRWLCLALCLLFLLVWGAWLFNTAPRIDTEMRLNEPAGTYGWLDIGRQGGILTNRLMGMGFFNPLLAVWTGYLIIFAAGQLMGYLLWRAGQRGQRLCPLFGFALFTAPIMAEQFYFDMQIFEVACAYLFCAGAVAFSYLGLLKKRKLCLLMALPLMIWAFSTYQIFCVLYVVMAVACFMVYYRSRLEGGEWKADPLQLALRLAILFLIAFGINTLITNLFFTSGTYLNNQFMWGKTSLGAIADRIINHVKDGFLGRGVFYTPAYGLMAALAVAAALADVRKNAAPHKWLYAAAVCGLQLCPFLLTVYCGNVPPFRAQLAYPMVIACNMIYLLGRRWHRFLIKGAVICLAALTVWNQLGVTSRLIYTDEIRAQEDIRTAQRLSADIEAAVEDSSKPMVFVGVRSNRLNNACLRGDVVGTSFFHVNHDELPHYYSSSGRINNLFVLLGLPAQMPDKNQVLAGRKAAQSMPCWPQPGSITDAGDYILVKLSEDQWPFEIVEQPLQACDLSGAVEADESMRRYLDAVSHSGDWLTISGWAFMEGVDSTQCTTALYLRNRESQEVFHLPAAVVERPDLGASLGTGDLHLRAGFQAIADISDLEDDLSGYELLIGIEYEGTLYLAETSYELT